MIPKEGDIFYVKVGCQKENYTPYLKSPFVLSFPKRVSYSEIKPLGQNCVWKQDSTVMRPDSKYN